MCVYKWVLDYCVVMKSLRIRKFSKFRGAMIVLFEMIPGQASHFSSFVLF